LQRSESMSFQNLLHLPASLFGVHVYNYIGSFVSLTLFCMLPMMLGLACASVVVFGPVMLLLFPLIAGFLCFLTAITYQLRGWLATLMSDKRKRGNVIALVTISFVMVLQVPNLINIGSSRSFSVDDLEEEVAVDSEDGSASDEAIEEPSTEDAELDEAELAADLAPESTAVETRPFHINGKKYKDVDEYYAERKVGRAEKLRKADYWGTRVLLAVPFGWLAFGARSLSSGHWMYAGLCILGMFGLGLLSLRRSYRTTLRFVTGVGTGNASLPVPVEASDEKREKTAAKALFVARDLPYFGEAVSSIGLVGMRGLIRAPEFKLLLLGPLILIIMGAVLYFTGDRPEVPELYRPGLGLGGIVLGLTCMGQLLQNCFGLDRQGFRAFVLSPQERHHILRGKNLSMAPFAIGIGLIPIVATQFVAPMGVVALLSTLLLSVAGFLLLSMMGNLISILVPVRFKEGAMQPANAKVKVILMQLAGMLVMPIILIPIAIPMGLSLLDHYLDLGGGAWIYPLASMLVLLGSAGLYNWIVQRQGPLLQRHEQRILDVLTRALD
jgi:ABC-2 type transport system permease protein